MTTVFQVVGAIESIEKIAVAGSIRELARLRKCYGPGRWRKLKGVARVRFPDGTMELTEVPWYEASGSGKKEIKIKRILD